MTSDLLCADRSMRGKLRLSGPQRAWFLHQVLTRSFEDIAPGEAREAAMLTGKGRMSGFLEVLATQDSLLCHFEEALKDKLPGELIRYLFATRAEIADVGGSYGLVLVAGAGWREAAGAALTDGLLHPTHGLGVPAGYVWVAPGDAKAALGALVNRGARAVGEDELEAIRIRGGAPRWGAEMTARTLPQEARLDAWALDYDKGCYIGQEVVAKIHFRGRVTKLLQRLSGEGPLVAGAEVSDGTAIVGRVTSAAKEAGLAVLKSSVVPGDVVVADGVPAEVLEEVW